MNRRNYFRSVLMVLAIIGVFVMGLTVGGVGVAASPGECTEPTTNQAPIAYKSATVDGDPSEWGTPQNPIPMYEAGNPSKTQISNAYLRYDCAKHRLYVLVLGVQGAPPLLKYSNDAWATLSGGPTKLYKGDGSVGEFAWIDMPDVTIYGATYDVVYGYEASFAIDPGTYSDLVIHVEFLKSDGSGGTSANEGFAQNACVRTALVISCPISPDPKLRVQKFYDANTNGALDPGELLINNWAVQIGNDVYLTPKELELPSGDYQVSEFAPVEANWFHTTASSLQVSLDAGEEETVSFGNVCVGAGGGLTIGFWSNKNGQALIGADDLQLLVSLNLRNANGSAFDPASNSSFRTWLLNATATNMAYMLSAQLAAMELNVLNGKVIGTSLVYAPGTSSANANGFATVNAVMDEANVSLGTSGNTVLAGPVRIYQEALKNALDRANNNLTFVQSNPCPFTFAP